MIVGAGPAGLEAACTLADLGHDVEVLERDDEPGGRLRLAWRLPRRNELQKAIEPRLAHLDRSRVPIRLGVEGTPSVLDELDPDLVVLATGAEPYRSPRYRGRPGETRIEGLDDLRVLTMDDVARGAAIGTRALVVDEEGTRAVAAGVEQLVDDGIEVVVVTTLPHLGHPALVLSQEWSTTVPPLVERGVRVEPFSRLVGVVGGAAHIVRTDRGGSVAIDGVDTVVLALGGTVPPGPDLDRPSVRIGDCLAPRDLGGALLDGRRVARDLVG